MKKILTVAVISALGAVSTSALADTRINGFATITAGVMSDEDTSLFGYSDEVSFKPESLFALQLASDLGEGLSATAQIMSRGRDDYKAEFEWAYISYEINDSTQINAGKLRIPFYRYSDFLDVGYAYTWIRTPQTVYDLPFSKYDGISIVNSHTIGDVDSTVQFTYGSYEGEVNVYGDAKLSNLTGINWTANYDWLTARAVYMVGDTSLNFDLPPSYVTEIEGISQAAMDSLYVEGDSSSFFGFGLSVDYNNVLIDTEFTNVEVEDSLVATQKQYYISIGYRFDTYTVYATSEHKEDINDDDYSAQLAMSSPIAAAYYQGILKTTETESDAFTVGVRYNFHPSAALKVDYTTYDTIEGSVGESVESSLFSVGVNVVF